MFATSATVYCCGDTSSAAVYCCGGTSSAAVYCCRGTNYKLRNSKLLSTLDFTIRDIAHLGLRLYTTVARSCNSCIVLSQKRQSFATTPYNCRQIVDGLQQHLTTVAKSSIFCNSTLQLSQNCNSCIQPLAPNRETLLLLWNLEYSRARHNCSINSWEGESCTCNLKLIPPEPCPVIYVGPGATFLDQKLAILELNTKVNPLGPRSCTARCCWNDPFALLLTRC